VVHSLLFLIEINSYFVSIHFEYYLKVSLYGILTCFRLSMRRLSLTDEIRGKDAQTAQARIDDVLNSLPMHDRAQVLQDYHKKPVATKEKQSLLARLIDSVFERKNKTKGVLQLALFIFLRLLFQLLLIPSSLSNLLGPFLLLHHLLPPLPTRMVLPITCISRLWEKALLEK
jgi:hypothetical protein